MTEGVRIPHFGSVLDENVPHLYGDEALAQWDLVRQDVQAAGGKIMPQLWHIGLMLNPEQASVRVRWRALLLASVARPGSAEGMNVPMRQCAEPMSAR